MTETSTRLTPDQTQVAALAPVMQRWAELCKRQSEVEPSAALRWYLHGRADAHALDAARAREALSPSAQNTPPRDGVSFTRAYETLLQMLSSMSEASPQTPADESQTST